MDIFQKGISGSKKTMKKMELENLLTLVLFT